MKDNNEYDEEKRTFGNSWVVTVLIILLFGGIIAGGAYYLGELGYDVPFFKHDKVSRFADALNENNYQMAYSIYINSSNQAVELNELNAHLNSFFELCASEEYSSECWSKIRGLEIFKDEIEPQVTARMNEIVSQAYNDIIGIEKAKTLLSRVGKFDFELDNLRKCGEQLNEKADSDAMYLEGVYAFNGGDYVTAVEAFKQVSELDSIRFPLAVDAIAQAKGIYGTERLRDAQKALDANNLEKARGVLEELIELFGTYEDAENMLAQIT